jgi:hypothetical protein
MIRANYGGVIQMSGSEGGPHVQLALFAEKFIRGAQSGALTIINIIDGISVQGPSANEMPPFSLEPLMIFINLWSDRTKGRFTIKLRPQEPSGLHGDLIEIGPANFTATALGVDIARPMPPYEITEEGTTWFDVMLVAPGDDEGQVLTRIPFNVTYQQTVTLQQP